MNSKLNRLRKKIIVVDHNTTRQGILPSLTSSLMIVAVSMVSKNIDRIPQLNSGCITRSPGTMSNRSLRLCSISSSSATMATDYPPRLNRGGKPQPWLRKLRSSPTSRNLSEPDDPGKTPKAQGQQCQVRRFGHLGVLHHIPDRHAVSKRKKGGSPLPFSGYHGKIGVGCGLGCGSGAGRSGRVGVMAGRGRTTITSKN